MPQSDSAQDIKIVFTQPSTTGPSISGWQPYNNNEGKSIQEKIEKNFIDSGKIIESDNLIKVLLDTNVIFAYLNSKNQFHLEAHSSIDALKLIDNVWIVVSYISLGEFIAHRNLVSGKCSIKNALIKFDKFLHSINRHLQGGPVLNSDIIIKRYTLHSHHIKFTEAGFADFMLLTQAEEIKNVKILTCDKKMYKSGKTIFKNNIYYLPNNTTEVKSDYTRLMSEIQNKFR